MSQDLDDIRSLDTPLIIYAGPELTRLAGLPSMHELVQALLREAEDYLSVAQHRELTALAAGPELAAVFSELERALTAATMAGIIERKLDDARVEPPPLAHAIASLLPRLRGVITPNLDLLLERAFAGQLVVHATPTADLPSRRGWLLKLHGTLHDRSTWVLTSEQLGRAAYRDSLHRDVFRSLFLSHPILFVATHLDDPLLAEFVAQINAGVQGQPPRHWALVDAAEAGPINRRKFATAGIRLIGYDNAAGDHAEATRMLTALAGNAAPRPAAARAPTPSAPPPPPAPAPATAATTTTVLFLAANPSDTDPLRIDRELRVIREAIERSRYRGALELDIRTAATVHDLRRALLEKDYAIIHVSGHGESDGLLLEDDRGHSVEVPKQALAKLFARHASKGTLRCVLLNACWSSELGSLPEMTVPFAIGMDGPISDIGALEFSRGFYDAIGAGEDVAAAYEEGMSCVELAAPGATFVCRLLRPGGN